MKLKIVVLFFLNINFLYGQFYYDSIAPSDTNSLFNIDYCSGGCFPDLGYIKVYTDSGKIFATTKYLPLNKNCYYYTDSFLIEELDKDP